MIARWEDVFTAGVQGDYDRARMILGRLSGEKAALFLAWAASQMNGETRTAFLAGLADTVEDVPAVEVSDLGPSPACAWHNVASDGCAECRVVNGNHLLERDE